MIGIVEDIFDFSALIFANLILNLLGFANRATMASGGIFQQWLNRKKEA